MPRKIEPKEPGLHLVVLHRTARSLAIDDSYPTSVRTEAIKAINTAITLLTEEQLRRASKAGQKAAS